MILKYIINDNINVKFYKSFKEMFTDLKYNYYKSDKGDINSIILLESNGINNSFNSVHELLTYCKQVLKERKKAKNEHTS